MRPMPQALPRIEAQSASDGARVRVLGPWTAAQLADRGRLRELQASLGAASPRAWDLNEAQLDHVGAQILWDHWGQRWPEQLDAPPAQRAVLERVAKFTVPPPERKHRTLWDYWLAFGGAVLRA